MRYTRSPVASHLFALLLLVGCGGSDPVAPTPVDFTPLESWWTLTPEVDSARVLVFSGIQHQGPDFAVANVVLYWGRTQYDGGAQLSATSMTLDFNVGIGSVLRRHDTYTYTVNATTVTLTRTENGFTETYQRSQGP